MVNGWTIALFLAAAQGMLLSGTLLGFANDKILRELSTHEFGHSFVNPQIAKLPRALVKQTAPLFDTVKTAMSDQGYDTWFTCITEHFVRAGEIVIAEALGETKAAAQLRAEYIQERQFIYLPLIIAELQRYRNDPSITYEAVIQTVMQKLTEMVTRKL